MLIRHMRLPKEAVPKSNAYTPAHVYTQGLNNLLLFAIVSVRDLLLFTIVTGGVPTSYTQGNIHKGIALKVP